MHFFAREYIVFPNEIVELNGFLLVLGCIDGTHAPILAPPCNENLFVNRKNFHSINVQAICDSDLTFIDIVAKWPGPTHDAFIWRQSGINQRIASGDIPSVKGLLVEIYPLSKDC